VANKLCTVKKHVANIFEKLRVENRAAAASCLRAMPFHADPNALSSGAAFRVEKAAVEAN